MNFAWAMDMVLNQERAVRREMWHKDGYILKSREMLKYCHFGYSPDIKSWTPCTADMLAEDWVEVLEV